MREMKNSGVEWIGDIPAEWQIRRNKTLFDCSKEIVGSHSSATQLLSLTTQGIKKKGQDVLGGKMPETFDTYQTVNPNDIVMCLFDLDCSAVFSGISSFSGMISPAYKVLKCKNELLPKYADYWFRFVFVDRKFKTYAKNLRYTLNYDEFAILPILLPNINEQKRIADFLDRTCSEIDTVIEKTKATIEEYKKLKQSVITEAVTKGIRGNRPMKDSGIEWIGDIPADWNMLKMNKVCSVITDYVASGSFASLAANVEYLDEPDYAMLIRTMDISGKGYSGKPVYISEHSYNFLSNSNLFGGEIILPNIGASVGDVYIVPKLYERMSLAPNSIMIRTLVNDKYVYYYYCSVPGRLSLVDIAESTAQPKFNKTDFRQLKMPVPAEEEQKEIVDYLDSKCAEIDKLIADKTHLLEEMESYKKSVIYEYVTGKKEVK